MGRAAQAATDQPVRLDPQTEQHGQGGAGATRHALGHHQGPVLGPGGPTGAQPLPPADQIPHPLPLQGPAAAQAAGRSLGSPVQMGHGRGHAEAKIHHQHRQAQGLDHHLADQGRRDPRR